MPPLSIRHTGRPRPGLSRRRRRRRLVTSLVAICVVAIVALTAAAAGGFLAFRPPWLAEAGPGSYVPPSGSGIPVREAPRLPVAWYASGPYVMPLTGDAPDLAAVQKATGQRAFQLAFILADHGLCSAAWNGSRPVATENGVARLIDSVRANGGDVSIALGGGGGTKLGQVCPDAESTALAYQRVVDRYHVRAVDLDLEDPEWRDLAATSRELAAMKLLKDWNPGLYVSVTLPTNEGTMALRAVGVLESAADLGFIPDNVSIMPFDFHGDGPMGPAAVASVEALHEQLMRIFGWDSAEAYHRAGASLMNGRTDHGEFYTADDFETVLAYAVEHDLGRFTYWSLNRDRQCNPIDNGGRTSGSCSGVAQEPWAFARYTARFGGSEAAAAPTRHPSASPRPSAARKSPAVKSPPPKSTPPERAPGSTKP